MSYQARAAFLGAAGWLALVRCGLCGRRNCFDLRRWRWFEVPFCRRCWQGVRFEGLVMVSRWEGERLLLENEAFGGELRALREVERVARDVLRHYGAEPHWFWPLRVRRMAEELRTPFALAESARASRNADVGPQPAPAPPEAAASGDVYELTEEEGRALDYFAACPPAVRENVLEYLEVMSRQAAGGEGDEGEVRTPAPPALTTDDEEGDDDG